MPVSNSVAPLPALRRFTSARAGLGYEILGKGEPTLLVIADRCRVGTRSDRDGTVTVFQPHVCYSKIDDEGIGSSVASR